MTADTPLPAYLAEAAANPVAGNAEVEAIRALANSLFDAIQHGDGEHRAWLRTAISAHFAGEPVPPPSGSGSKEKLIDSLSAEVAGKDKAVNDAVTATIDAGASLLRKHAESASKYWAIHLLWGADQVETLKTALAALPVPAAEGK